MVQFPTFNKFRFRFLWTKSYGPNGFYGSGSTTLVGKKGVAVRPSASQILSTYILHRSNFARYSFVELNCRYIATNRQLLSYVLKKLAIYAHMIYTAPCVTLLMRAVSITRASVRGMGPGNRDFFGPCEMASSR
jgi:hypothetical protein